LGPEVPQVEYYEPSYKVLRQYLRSLTLYEGFETRAHFDVLWMSDDIRCMYAALRAQKVGYNKEEHDAFLLRQLEENRHWIQFYLLAEVHDLFRVSLGEKNSAWSFYLESEKGVRVMPLELKEVDLEPEIRALFGNTYVPSKKVYRLKFAANDLIGKPYFVVNDKLTLVCAGSGMAGAFVWNIPAIIQREELKKRHVLQHRENKKTVSFFEELSNQQEKTTDFFW